MKSMALVICFTASASLVLAADDWPQLLGDALRSGNAPAASVQLPLSLAAALPLTDGIYAAPVVSGGKLIAIDGSGVVFAFDAATLQPLWKFATKGGAGNCNNVAAPAVIGKYV